MSGDQSEHGSRAVFAPRGCLQHICWINDLLSYVE